MSNLILSFFDEEVFIKSPKSFQELLSKISSSFLLNPEDAKELIITYEDKNRRKFKIKDEADYKSFLPKKITKINLDISQNSSIYIKEYKQQEETEANRQKLENLLKLENEIKKGEREKMKEINELMKKYGAGANALIKNFSSIQNQKHGQLQKIRKEINELKMKLVDSEKVEDIKLKVNPKKEEKLTVKKEDDKKKKVIHKEYICDGCDAEPIVGIRYKCTVCEDFDFCEKCEKKLGIKHGHPLLKIRDPKIAPLYFKCSLLKNNK